MFSFPEMNAEETIRPGPSISISWPSIRPTNSRSQLNNVKVRPANRRTVDFLQQFALFREKVGLACRGNAVNDFVVDLARDPATWVDDGNSGEFHYMSLDVAML